MSNRYFYAQVKDVDGIRHVVAVSDLSEPVSDPHLIEIGDFNDVKLGYIYQDGIFNPPEIHDSPVPLPVLQVTNVNVSSGMLVGSIHWVPIGAVWVLTANVALPDSQMMIMVERIVDASTPVDDVRFIANISEGILTINGVFEKSGNYVISAERLNRGLSRIGALFRLEFESVEFDAYINTSI
tara:strand:+ start:3102 stop:3650 length:549 start_codon:yes stop_codon:yes gene_type:complete